MENIIDKTKPVWLTILPAGAGNFLGMAIPPDSVIPIIPVLQSLAYTVSIIIGIFQIMKYMKENKKRWKDIALGFWKRWWAPTNPILKTIGDFALVMIPVLEVVSFSNPDLNDKKQLVYIILISVKFITNFSLKSDAKQSNKNR